MITQIRNYLPGDHPWQNQIIWYDVTDSTNTQAKKLAMEGAPSGTVLIAEQHTGGKGRMGRSFQSPGSMGVYMSVILRLPCKPAQLMHLTCAAAVAACDAVEAAAGFCPGIKWTNDLVHDKRKLAGILTELIILPEETVAIIGIGINCRQTLSDFSDDIRCFAGSLQMFAQTDVDRAKVAAALIEAFSQMAQQLLSEKESILKRYRDHCVTLGKDIQLLYADTVSYGHAVDIDADGALLIRLPDGSMRTVNAGEVSIRGMYGYN